MPCNLQIGKTPGELAAFGVQQDTQYTTLFEFVNVSIQTICFFSAVGARITVI